MRGSLSSGRPGWAALFASTLLATSAVAAYTPRRFISPRHDTTRKLRPRLLKRQLVIEDGAEDGMDMGMPEMPDEHYVTLPLDHFDAANKETLSNRYWVEDSAYKPGGPIIFQDLGEFAGEIGLGMDPSSKYSMTIANKTGGLVIMWEHRFYGQSIPDIDSSIVEPGNLAKYMKPLTLENSLEDIVTFSKSFKYKNETLNPGTAPWIFVGESYAGARSAWMRKRNPEIAFAALADAAVVEQDVEYRDYYKTIEDALRVDHSTCTDDLIRFAEWQNEVFTGENKEEFEAWLKAIGASEGSPLHDHFVSLGNLQEGYWEMARSIFKYTTDLLYAEFQMIGFTEESAAITLCNSIQDEATKKNSDAKANILEKGIVGALGWDAAKPLIDAVIGDLWATYIKSFEEAGIPQMPTMIELAELCKDGDIESCKSWVVPNTWFWQGCSDTGNLVTAGNSKIAPAYNTAEKLMQDCTFTFGDAVASGPTIGAQAKYGGLKMDLSNTMWTDGSLDPLRGMTPNSETSERSVTDNIPDAGVALGGEEFFGAVANGSFHGAITGCTAWLYVGEDKINEPLTREWNDGWDGGCSAEVSAAQQLFLDALDKWLPAFKKHDVGSNAPGYNDGPQAPVQPEPETSGGSSFFWDFKGIMEGWKLKFNFGKNYQGPTQHEIEAHLNGPQKNDPAPVMYARRFRFFR